MLHQLCAKGRWPNPVPVKDNDNETAWSKPVRLQHQPALRNYLLDKLTMARHVKAKYVDDRHTSEVDTIQLDSQIEMLSLEDAFSFLELMSGLPSIEDLICISQKCRHEKCTTYAMSAYALVCDHGLEAHKALGNYLVPMLVDCGSMLNAQQLFNKLPYCNDCSWSCLIRGYTEAGNMHHALDLHQVMHDYGVYPSRFTYVSLLSACVELKYVEKGQKLHSEIIEEGLEIDTYVGNTLVRMYVSFSLLDESQDVLNQLPIRDVISWTTLISGYAEQGLAEKALSCLERMQSEGLPPNETSYVCALKACGGNGDKVKGRDMHREIMIKGFEEDIYVGNSLIDMYAKCSLLTEAQKVFDEMPVRDVISWTTLMAGYAEHGPAEKTLYTMEQMQHSGVCLNAFSFVCVLKACCSTMGGRDEGQRLHAEITKRGFDEDIFVGNILVDLYAKLGLLEESWEVFNQLPIHDVITCTALITGFLERGCNVDVLYFINQMQVWGVSPNAFMLVCGVKACSHLTELASGLELHGDIAIKGLEGDFIINASLMDMYRRCGLLEETRCLFDFMHIRDVVSWNIMIISFVEHKQSKTALEMLGRIKEQGCMPDHGIFISILKACGNTGASDIGKNIHAQLHQPETLDPNVSSALIDMYGRCGNMVEAQEVFDAMLSRDLVAWSALITGYARKGECRMAFDLFDRMMWEGIRPDAVVFLTILSVCNHVGFLDRAQGYFEIMTKRYAITPTIKHSTCLIDLLGRAGQLDEAADMADKMPFGDRLALWITLLGACKKWKNVAIGRLAFDRIMALNKKDLSAYISMESIYKEAYMWEDAEKIETTRASMQASMGLESSWTESGK